MSRVVILATSLLAVLFLAVPTPGMQTPKFLHGEVVDAHRRPVAAPGGRPFANSVVLVSDFRIDRSSNTIRDIYLTVTNDRGECVLTGNAGSYVSINVWDPRYQPRSLPYPGFGVPFPSAGQTGRAQLELDPSSSISGTITDCRTGAPMNGVRVIFALSETGVYLAMATTNEKGEYRIDRSKPDGYELWCFTLPFLPGKPGTPRIYAAYSVVKGESTFILKRGGNRIVNFAIAPAGTYEEGESPPFAAQR